MDNLMCKHTPGPWFVDQDRRMGMDWNRHILSDSDHAICFMAHSDGKDNGRDEANANLISSAPDLLEALVDVMFRHVPFSDKSALAEKARAAIAKATGETP